VSDIIKNKQLSIKINVDGCENVWVELTLNQNKSVIVGAVYRHPNQNIKPFEDTFVNAMKKIQCYPKLYSASDCHINYDKNIWY